MKPLDSGQIGRLVPTAVVMLAAALPGCSEAAAKPKAAKAAAKPSASETAFADYRNWKAINPEPIAVSERQFTACEPAGEPAGAADPNGPHAGGLVNVYVNAVGRDEYLSSVAPAFAEGTVIVKEKLKAKDDKGPHEVGVMIKREAGYAPDNGDWQYVFVDGKGKETEKQSQMKCATCHQIQADNDYVFRRVRTTDADGNDNSPEVGNAPRGNAKN